ncbi:MAG: proline--tRNA ligase [Deltaproteobacteria bacterium]|nr:MAG: proline--tRNA ligase [Deltaproteobacteria bacterium]
MRYSKAFIPTLKETPAEAQVVSHRLMLRAGCIRKLTAGVYSYLPYGLAAIKNVENIVREEMNRAGALELSLPMVQPADLWQESGRYDHYGPELLRFRDRHDRESCLGPTHEEVITEIARAQLRSYRDLPVNLYQIQTKFRDEIRPRFGLMRGREFLMKDAYSFDADDQGAEESYRKMYAAYCRIFERCGLEYRAVQADSGAIGGNFSHEFMVLADTGEDTIVICNDCDYAANMEKAEVNLPEQSGADAEMLARQKVETPGKRKVVAVCEFLGIEPASLVKTLIYLADGEAVAVLVRGDREVEEVKLANFLHVSEVVMADDQQTFEAAGVPSGYLGPIGLPVRLVADQEVLTMKNFVIGANEKNYHLVNANVGRDFAVSEVADLRKISADDPCPACSGKLKLTQGIEVGHIFKLGTKYSEAMQANFRDRDGGEKPLVMGCYGIGVSRVAAAAIEQNHDENGIIFPVPIAPYQAVVLNLDLKNPEITAAAEKIYQELLAAGVKTLLDDRDERPGIKFKDSELLGIPFRITVGKSFINHGVVEIVERRSGGKSEAALEDTCGFVQKALKEVAPDNKR